MEENNENQDYQNVENSTVKKSPNNKLGWVLIAIIAIMLVVIGVLIGMLVTKNNTNNVTGNTVTGNTVTAGESKTSKKIDENKKWVYNGDYKKVNKIIYKDSSKKQSINSDDSLILPFININSEEAKKVNNEIANLYEKLYLEYGEKDPNTTGGDDKIYNIFTAHDTKYSYYLNNNILSIVIEHNAKKIIVDGGTGGGTTTLYTYNFNIDTLKEVTLEEMAKACGFNSASEVTDKINKWEENIKKLQTEKPDEYSSVGLEIQKGKYYIDNNKKLNFVYKTSTSETCDTAEIVEADKPIKDFYQNK